MNLDDIRRSIVAVLCDVAPEIEPAKLDPKAELRTSLDLDSMDFLNFVIGLHGSLGVEVPEADYGKLATVKTAVDYLESRPRA